MQARANAAAAEATAAATKQNAVRPSVGLQEAPWRVVLNCTTLLGTRWAFVI